MLIHDKSSGSQLQTIFLCLFALVMMAGCIVIPVPTGEKPYYDGAIPNLEVGVTSKSEVLQEFGVPDVTYPRNSELIYITTQESWKIAWASIIPNPDPKYSDRRSWEVEGFSGVGTLHKRFVLSLSFDTQDTLSAFELDTAGDDFGDCTSHGICLGKTNAVMRYADSVTESAAKGFKLNKDQCSIYLHGPGNKKAYEVSLNGKIPVSIFSTGAFVHWITRPGTQSLVIFPEPAYLDFDCKAGEIAFVHFDYRWTGTSKLYLEDQVTGREHLSNRRLVLLPTGTSGLPFPPSVLNEK
jgi:hypothetical protein